MGVYIKGMEMPPSCVLCRMSEYHVTNPYCKITEAKILRNRERNNDCPLVPVPEHGDLIDKSGVDVLSWTDGEHGTTFEDGVLFVLDKLDELPVIIPAEGEDYEVQADKEGEG